MNSLLYTRGSGDGRPSQPMNKCTGTTCASVLGTMLASSASHFERTTRKLSGLAQQK